MTVLECRRVVVLRPAEGGARAVLDGIDLRAEGGTVTALCGATGAGKTTLLHVLAGLLRPSAGEVLADGAAVSRWTARHRDRWRRGAGILFQGAELIDGLTAAENVLAPLVPRPLPAHQKRAACLRVLTALDVAGLAERPAGELSGGERQRIALARALVAEPGFLFVDEPSAHQDDAHLGLVLGQLAAARARGAVVVLASHDPRVLGGGLCDQLVRLAAGRRVGEAGG